jgi:hypothetical protein
VRVSVFALVFLVSLAISKSWPPALVITAIVGAVLYGFSLDRRPFRACRKCKGTGRHRGMIFLYAHRQCPECGGSGRHRRHGTVYFWGDQQTRGEQQASEASGRWNRPR